MNGVPCIAVCCSALQEYLRLRLIAFSEQPEAPVWAARVRERKAATGSRVSADRIIKLRNEGRR